MIIYLALAGVAMVLFWVDDADGTRAAAGLCRVARRRDRLLLPGLRLERQLGAVCDALSPVWLSDALLGGALMFALAWLSPADWKRRLALALGAGVIIAGFHALTWPQCLQRPEGVSPEVERLWLSHVKEARPFYTHGWRIATLIMALAGHRRDRLGACSPGGAGAIRSFAGA